MAQNPFSKYTPVDLTLTQLCNNIVITMQIQTIFQAGNSDVVALPRGLGFKRGEKVVVEKALDDEDVITIKKVSTKKAKDSASSAEFKRWLNNVLEEDAEILDELANR